MTCVLDREQSVDAAGGQIEHRVETRAVERRLLAGALHLDEAALAVHDDVHVDLGDGVLGVLEVEQQLAVDHADAGGRELARSAGSSVILPAACHVVSAS